MIDHPVLQVRMIRRLLCAKTYKRLLTGTDPEVLLRFETLEAEGKPKWHYQPVRFSWRALTLNHDNNSVWTVEEFRLRDAPNQQTPYLTGLTRPLPLTDP
jgi:hypothetical protein